MILRLDMRSNLQDERRTIFKHWKCSYRLRAAHSRSKHSQQVQGYNEARFCKVALGAHIRDRVEGGKCSKCVSRLGAAHIRLTSFQHFHVRSVAQIQNVALAFAPRAFANQLQDPRMLKSQA